MAGDWMKIELELPDKPEVHAIAGMLNVDPDAVVGKLIRVWQWFDKHTVDGNAHGVTYSLPDRISGVAGFGEAMAFVGWLEQRDVTLVMPRFDRHTSESAKARALTAKRVAKHKAKSNAEGNAEGNAVTVSDALPREEKRRNKNNTSDKPDAFCFKTALLDLGANADLVHDWLEVRKAKKAKNTRTALEGFVREVGKSGMSYDQAVRVCCEKNWQGFNAEWVKDIKPAAVEAKQPTITPEQDKRRREWAAFEYAVRDFRETKWPAGAEAHRINRAKELQAMADRFGVKFERPLLEAAQ